MGRSKAGAELRVCILNHWILAGLLIAAFCGCVAHRRSDSEAAAGRTFDVRDFGAIGDGKTISTTAIQKALDQCGLAGGGTVLFKSGTYLSQPLTLRTKTTLLLQKGAVLKATDERADFENADKP